MGLHNMLKSVSEQQGLEGWVQAKITKAADYLESVYHYLDYEMKSTGLAEAGPVAPGAVPAGSVTTPGDNTPINGASSGNDQLNQQKAAAAVALQRKQIQDQIRATQKQLQDLQKQLQTIGSIASATAQPKVQESASAGASSAGGIASVGMPMGKKKKEVGSLFGGTYTQGAAESAVLDKHFGTVPGPDIEHDKQKIRSLLTQMMGKLPAKYERILRMRFFQDMTHNQIAEKYQLSVSRIQQIEAKALRMLKQPNHRLSKKTLGGALDAYSDVNEASNPAQQAATAIAKKKSGKYRKDGERIKEGWKDAAAGAAMLGAVGAGGAHMMANADTSRVDGKDFYRYHGSVTDRIADKMHPAVDDKGREVYVWIDKIAKPSGVNRYYIPADKVNVKTNEGGQGKDYGESVAEGYTGRETKHGTWRVFKDGDPVAVAGPFKSKEEASAWIKKKEQGVKEGETGPKFTGYWKGKDKGKPGKKMVGSN